VKSGITKPWFAISPPTAPLPGILNCARLTLLLLALLLGSSQLAQAQWVTQSVVLKPGWNGVFLNVDASHASLDALVGADSNNPILEVWLWNPPLTQPSVSGSQTIDDNNSGWTSWMRGKPNGSLYNLLGDAAYLVFVRTNVSSYTWQVKGKPVVPRNAWQLNGLNFVGFSTLPNQAPDFSSFLNSSTELTNSPQIYQYVGGPLVPNVNPVLINSALFRATPVVRGKAYWINDKTTFNHYFGPFRVELTGSSGASFGDSSSTYSLRLRNLTSNPLTISVSLAASEPPPAGQPAIAGVPPLLLRGAINLTTLTYGYTNLPGGSPRSWTLAALNQPGSTLEVVLGLNRSAMAGNQPGDLVAGVLQFTDSLGFTEVDVPVSATASSNAGLWVGSATVNQVGQYLKSYQLDSDNHPVISSAGSYVVTNVNTALGPVPTSYPLRLIIHNPGSGGNSVLLQRVYYGVDANTNAIIATQEGALNHAYLNIARRISSSTLPWSATNRTWAFNGNLQPSGSLTTRVTLDYADQASNPFLHTYHPDHDNLDHNNNFQQLRQGQESYTIQRDITLSPSGPSADFASLTAGNSTISGSYYETITVLGLARSGNTNDSRTLQLSGSFTLDHISTIPILTAGP
jgi:hypothetical protein